ncbi:vegetative cell wall protein gp1-like isoform X2 [Teleopsis dalmanni]|uniref:vegetative cell wall protein gp1-like isoform X2 n=1 Tax=Teleopsis dalmanni TaxID=139649 RepID=UPI0018CCA52A|nr:vegetative cell wall protein gp1-like isoform X2 [Teleopsis dalmanni]
MDKNCNIPPTCPNTEPGVTPPRPRASTMDCSGRQGRRRWQTPAQQNRNPCTTPSWLNTSRPMAQQPGRTCSPPGPGGSPPCPSPAAPPGRRRWSISAPQNPCSGPGWLNATLPASQPSTPGWLNSSPQQCTPARLNATLSAVQEGIISNPTTPSITVTGEGNQPGSACPRSVSPPAQPRRRRWTLSGQRNPCTTPGWLNAARGTAQQPNPTCPSNSPPVAQSGRRRWSVSAAQKPCSTPGWLNSTLPTSQPSIPGCPNTTLPAQQQCAPGPLNATMPTPQEGRRRWTISAQQKPSGTPAWLKAVRQNACAAASDSPQRTCDNQPNACGSPASPNASPPRAGSPQRMSSPCPATPQRMGESPGPLFKTPSSVSRRRSPCPRTPVNMEEPATPRCPRTPQRLCSPCPETPQRMEQSPCPLFKTPSSVPRRPSPLFRTPSTAQRRASFSTSFCTPQGGNRLCPGTPTVQECSPRTPENTGRPVDKIFTSTPVPQSREGTPSNPSTPTCPNVSREFFAPQRARASTLDCSVIPRITGRNIELNFELPPRQTGNRDAPCPRTSASQLRHVMRMQRARNMRENSCQRGSQGSQSMSVGPRQSQSQFLAVPRPPRRRWGIPIRENQNCDGPSWINTLPIVDEVQHNQTTDCCPEREEMFDSC